jgi:hypothetical protein
MLHDAPNELKKKQERNVLRGRMESREIPNIEIPPSYVHSPPVASSPGYIDMVECGLGHMQGVWRRSKRVRSRKLS